MQPQELVLTNTATTPLPTSPDGPVEGSAPVAEKRERLRESFSYRLRLPITAAVLLAGWGAALFSLPRLDQGSWLFVLTDNLGWLTLVLGIGIRIWATAHIGMRKSREVVFHGPYSLCRNPLYVGTFLQMFSQALFLKSLTFSVSGFAIVLLYTIGVVPAEERFLRKRLGPEYVMYLETVPRWLPRLGKGLSGTESTISEKPLLLECIRSAYWLALPLLSTLSVFLQHQTWWPHLWTLP